MLLKLDENLGRSNVELFRNAGYDADRVHDQGLSGWTDSAIWKRVSDEGRFFITLDPDFADIRLLQALVLIRESYCCGRVAPK